MYFTVIYFLEGLNDSMHQEDERIIDAQMIVAFSPVLRAIIPQPTGWVVMALPSYDVSILTAASGLTHPARD